MTADILELPGLFVSGDWLREHLDDPRLVLLDAKPSEYEGESSGILPGARHIELSDLSDPSSGLNYTLADPAKIAAGFAAVGVGDDSTVVTYDHGRGSWAALIRLRLGSIGFERAGVLDGGPRAWAAAGRPYVESYTPWPSRPARLTVRPRPELHARIDRVQAAATDGQLLANLAPEVFAGEQSPLERLGALVLNELGNQDVAVFDGGLEEWNADPERPLELGDAQSRHAVPGFGGQIGPSWV